LNEEEGSRSVTLRNPRHFAAVTSAVGQMVPTFTVGIWPLELSSIHSCLSGHGPIGPLDLVGHMSLQESLTNPLPGDLHTSRVLNSC
jgi:hypothetical protein